MAAYSGAVTKADRGPVPENFEEKPHHITKHGKVVGFKNTHPSFGPGVSPFMLTLRILRKTLRGEMKWPDTSPPTVPVVAPTFLPTRTAGPSEPPRALRATWLGHACYYVEYPSGLRVLFDPVFEDRCSPFHHLGPKRFTEPPCAIADLPFVDAVVISHSHYDHLSHPSVLEVARHHPRAHFFVGKGLEHWFRASGVPNVTELDWWEDAELTLTLDGSSSAAAVAAEKPAVVDPVPSNGAAPSSATPSGSGDPATITARFSCLPAQHTSARTPFDKDTTLWASWAVSSGGKSVWFGGDTGYRAVPDLPPDVDDYGPEYESLPRCPQFAEIGRLRGPFDLGLIPIGAYAPRSFFSPVHANPFDSVEIFVDTQCRRAMGIHWGTWALTIEAVMEPPKLLREALKRKGIAEEGVFDVCDIGESREF